MIVDSRSLEIAIRERRLDQDLVISESPNAEIIELMSVIDGTYQPKVTITDFASVKYSSKPIVVEKAKVRK